MTAIEIANLTKRYGDHVAINGIDLSVERGEVFGFLGPNGAGKSTTINILLDYIRPTSGSVTILGYDAQEETRAVHDRIGVVPEGYALYDRLTGHEHLRLAGRLNDADIDQAEILNRVGLSADDAARPAGAYSTGMQQRLALGMATVGDPDILVLDEPTSGLDPHGVSLLKQLICEEVDRGTTVFFSSHVLDHVESVCDRVGILTDGQLAAVDTVDGLRNGVSGGTTIELTVSEVTDALVSSLSALADVESVRTEDASLSISVAHAGVKPALIKRTREAEVTLLDMSVREESLDDLFDRYTSVEGSSNDRPEIVEA